MKHADLVFVKHAPGMGAPSSLRCYWWRDVLRIGSVVLALRSHSRPEQVPLSERNRMLQRPRAQFASRTGRSGGRQDRPYFLLTPSNPGSQERTEEASSLRHMFKTCMSPKQFRECWERLSKDERFDASVVGSAMQRCGQGRWWDELVLIHAAHQKIGITLQCVGHSIFLRALAHCLRCGSASAEVTRRRKEQALALAQGSWGEFLPTNEANFNCGLSSALTLCVRIGLTAAHEWADALWEWSKEQVFQKTLVTYAARMNVCEQRRQQDQVLDLLAECRVQRLAPNQVVLGGLLDQAAGHCDWKRADDIWRLLVEGQGVDPHFLAYTAHAKAHLSAGRPHMSVHIIDTMLKSSQHKLDYKLAVDYLQALLLVSHSSLAATHIQQLATFLEQGRKIVAEKSARSGKQAWARLSSQAFKLIEDPESVPFKDLLVTRNACEHSVMIHWENRPAGSDYLQGMPSAKKAPAATPGGIEL